MATEPVYRLEEDEISTKEFILRIQDWFRYLWANWKIILFVGVLGGLIGVGYSIWKTPMYVATTTFVLEGGDAKGGLGRYAGLAAMAGIDLGGDAGGIFQGNNILELYKSRAMLEQALLSDTHPDSNELLIERYIAYNGIREGWKENPDLLALDFREEPSKLNFKMQRMRDSVITRLSNTIRDGMLVVDKPDKALSIIRVAVRSPDEVFAKSFNDNLVRRVNDFYIETKTKKSTNNIAMLEAKVDSVRAVMEAAIYSAAQVSDATPNLNPTRQAQRIAPTQEAQFSAEANKAILSQLLQNLELTKMTLLQEQPLIQLVDQPVYPLTVERIGKLKGMVFGGILFGFLAVLWLTARKHYKDIMAS